MMFCILSEGFQKCTFTFFHGHWHLEYNDMLSPTLVDYYRKNFMWLQKYLEFILSLSSHKIYYSTLELYNMS